MTINLPKGEFCQPRVVFLDQVIGQEMAPVAVKVEAILKCPASTDKCEVMRFVGMAGYYHKFCYSFSVVASHLHTTLLQYRQVYMVQSKVLVTLTTCIEGT